MDTPLPLYLIGSFTDRGVLRLGEGGGGTRKVTRVSEADAFPQPGSTPGWVILSPELPDAVVIGLLRRMGCAHGPWSPLLLLGDLDDLQDLADRDDLGNPEDLGTLKAGDVNGELRLLPLSPGTSVTVETLQGRLQEEDTQATSLSHRLLVAELARIRHDVNNPLTAALAEVQLLLMDQPGDSEEAESLRVVEAQLQRIRDLVAKLSAGRVSGW